MYLALTNVYTNRILQTTDKACYIGRYGMKRKKEPKTEVVILRTSKTWLDNVQAVANYEGTSVSQVIRESVKKYIRRRRYEALCE